MGPLDLGEVKPQVNLEKYDKLPGIPWILGYLRIRIRIRIRIRYPGILGYLYQGSLTVQGYIWMSGIGLPLPQVQEVPAGMHVTGVVCLA